jgi:hypothetical protein
MANVSPPFFCSKCGKEVGYTYDAKTGLYTPDGCRSPNCASCDLLPAARPPRTSQHLRLPQPPVILRISCRAKPMRIALFFYHAAFFTGSKLLSSSGSPPPESKETHRQRRRTSMI